MKLREFKFNLNYGNVQCTGDKFKAVKTLRDVFGKILKRRRKCLGVF